MNRSIANGKGIRLIHDQKRKERSMKKVTVKLYKISGKLTDIAICSPSNKLIKKYTETPVCYYFFMHGRANPVVSYEMAIQDYGKHYPIYCNECPQDFAREGIDELFTEAEAEKFNKYFNKHFDVQLSIQQQRLPIDLFEACRMAFQRKSNGGYWSIHEDETYDLKFDVRGYLYDDDFLPDEIRLFADGRSAEYKVKETLSKLSPFEKQLVREHRLNESTRSPQSKKGKIKDWQELCDQLPTSYKL